MGAGELPGPVHVLVAMPFAMEQAVVTSELTCAGCWDLRAIRGHAAADVWLRVIA